MSSGSFNGEVMKDSGETLNSAAGSSVQWTTISTNIIITHKV